MNTSIGKDDRPLITTDMAAYSMGLSPKRFRDWARRRGITPASSRPNPNRGQALALWDLADIAGVLRQAGRSADTSTVR
ncbi:hypothetical protein [Streptomyces sp. NPDC001914]|uniref:hypothetical protein n=1 Tax=Streptomyces sp. NPDC001914 TaxID=3364623 RepID=UPI0036CACAC7